MRKFCAVCEYEFKDGDKLVAVMLSEYKDLESDVHYAITPPTSCVEIIHRGCYDFPETEEGQYYAGMDS